MSFHHLPIKLTTTLAILGCSLFAGPAAGTALAAPCAGAGADPVETPRAELARTTVCLVNEERADRGLRKLQLNPRLSRAAHVHSQDMVARRYFGHVSKSGRDVIDRLRSTGYLGGAQSWSVGENLAWGSGKRGRPGEIVEAWMASPGHRLNMLDPRFREIGIGVVTGTPAGRAANGGTYTNTFGFRRG